MPNYPITMAGPPGPREARPEDKLHDPATQRARVCGRKGFTRRRGGRGEEKELRVLRVSA
jgi:hypothetical protein